MHTRKLGNTGLMVSAIGLGCAQLASSRTGVAVEIVRRAVELGITYFDVARIYGDAESKLGLGLEGKRDDVVISTKTIRHTREGAWREINESLERLRTGYIDNVHLHRLQSGEDMDRHLGPGGSLEALIEARDQGMIHHIGCTGHRSDALIEALNRFDFEIILVPLNIVEREPLERLIPLCQERGVGVTIMKPLATGLLPASLALKWLLNQPIASAVPGTTTLAELEANAAVGERPATLTTWERGVIQGFQEKLKHVRCHLCGLCHPCPQEIDIEATLGTDEIYNHYRTMGPAAFRSFPWSSEVVDKELVKRPRRIARIEACDGCGDCEERCPHGLPIMGMLANLLPGMRDMVSIYEELRDK